MTVETEKSKLRIELEQYHDKTIEAYRKKNRNVSLESNKDSDLPDDVRTQKRRVNEFLRTVNEDKQPIQKIITYMKRIPKVVRDPKTGKAEKKEFLEVHSELRGVDWKDEPKRVIDFYIGFHYEPVIITTKKGRDWDTGEFILNTNKEGDTKVYDIELTKNNMKQVIQDMINNATGSHTDEIKFYYQVPDSPKSAAFRTNIYTYDMFINSSPVEMENLALTTVSPIHSNKDKKSYFG